MISNRLSGTAFNLKSAGKNISGEWNGISGTVVVDGGPSELASTAELRQIAISNGITNEIEISALPGDLSFRNSIALFVFALKIPNGGEVSVTITDVSITQISTHNFDITASSPSVNADGVASPQWSIIRVLTSEFTAVTPSLKINIEITKNVDETAYFTTPVLVPQMEFIRENTALQYISGFLPQFMLEEDFETVTPIDMPLHRFIDVATIGIDAAVTKALEISYVDSSFGKDVDDIETFSSLVETEKAGLSELVWLAKFVGTKPVTRFVSSTETTTDPFLLDDSTLVPGTDTLSLTSTSSLNPSALDDSAQRELVKWQVDTRNFGFNAGTTSAMIEATQLMLVDTKTVTLVYDYGTNPFEITIQTKWDETLGGDISLIGQSSSLVLEAVAKAKPIGVLLTHEMTA